MSSIAWYVLVRFSLQVSLTDAKFLFLRLFVDQERDSGPAFRYDAIPNNIRLSLERKGDP
jgi:hypothetical protein